MEYLLKSVVFSSGERFINLFSPDGWPMFWPTLWSITNYRGRGKSINTIETALRSVKCLYEYLDEAEINLDERIGQGMLLSLNELEALLNRLRLYRKQDIKKDNVLDFKRKESKPLTLKALNPGSYSARLIYVSSYLTFRAYVALSKLTHKDPHKQDLQSALHIKDEFFKGRGPRKSSSIKEREGLGSEKLKLLNKVTSSSSKENPWKNRVVRLRNQLIIQLLADTGVRRGELLNIKIEDVNFREQTLKIIKRPNDIGDPRKYQPLVKTLTREIPISISLCELIKVYVFEYRSCHKQAQKHGYLLTSNRDGKPLSIKSLNAIFDKIRASVPELSKDLHPHLLRHTWNDTFSEMVDQKNIPEEQEKRIRTLLMGWSPTSEMPSIYTRRHTKKKAKEILQAQQEKVLRDLDER